MVRDPLNGDGRRYGVDKIVDWEFRGLDEMSASHQDLLSVEKSTEIEEWLALVDVQDNPDSMAAVSSS